MVKDIREVLPVSPLPVPASGSRPGSGLGVRPAFEQALRRELVKSQELKFSAHAEKRLKERNIALDPEDLAKIHQAVRQAEAKGARESLILYGDLALIASVKNRTVVTAVDGRSAREHVFTNIDSAVIVR